MLSTLSLQTSIHYNHREHTNSRNLNLTYSSYCQENSHYTSHLNILASQDPQYDIIPPICTRARVTEEDRAQCIVHGQEVVIVSSQDCQENAHCGSGQEEVAVLSHDCQENLHCAQSVNNSTPQAPEYDVIPALAIRARVTEEDRAQVNNHGQEVVIVSSQENAHCGPGQKEVAVLSHDCQENLHYASSINNLTPQAPEYDVIPALATRAGTACTEEDGAQRSDHGQK